MRNAIEQNGIQIVRTPKGIAVNPGGLDSFVPVPLEIEVRYLGRVVKKETINSTGPPWRDYCPLYDMLQCAITVRRGFEVLAELTVPDEPLPFMIMQGDQVHITENYVSIPPALTITDEVGAVWTLGLVKAQPHESPKGEFAFAVLRDGVATGEIASRIERRNSKVRIFTRWGWKVWTASTFF